LKHKIINQYEKSKIAARNCLGVSGNCFPTGINNPNDKPSSFQANVNISYVQIYEHCNYGGRSKIFYRSQAGSYGGVLFYIDNNTNWMVVGRLKDWDMAFLNTWDDDVSSIRLGSAN